MDVERQPPHSLDAEEATLGSILIDFFGDNCAEKVIDILESRDFYRDKNQMVFSAIKSTIQKGLKPDINTVSHELGDKFKGFGGRDYLVNLAQNTPTSSHAEYYARIVKKCSQQRDVVAAGAAIAELGYTTEPEESTNEALKKVLALKEQTSEQELEPIGDYALAHVEEFDSWVDGGFQPQGILTGFKDLDRILGGLKRGQLVYVCGRPSMGKSQSLLHIAKNCGLRGEASAFFSLEMSKADLYESLVFAEAKVNAQDIRRNAGQALLADGRPAQSVKLKNKYTELMALPVWIDDSASLKTSKAQSKLLRVMARNDIKIMFFDHLSLAGDEVKSGNEVQRVGRISKGLKAIAKTCNVPVVAACQLSREVSKVRSNHRPHLEDLRWSGDLEQDADIVLGLYRDEYYNPEGTSKYRADCANLLEISVLKQRRGAANPRGGLGTGIFYDVKTGFMGNWQGEFPARGEE